LRKTVKSEMTQVSGSNNRTRPVTLISVGSLIQIIGGELARQLFTFPTKG
jgi:hypothetical protein